MSFFQPVGSGLLLNACRCLKRGGGAASDVDVGRFLPRGLICSQRSKSPLGCRIGDLFAGRADVVFWGSGARSIKHGYLNLRLASSARRLYSILEGKVRSGPSRNYFNMKVVRYVELRFVTQHRGILHGHRLLRSPLYTRTQFHAC